MCSTERSPPQTKRGVEARFVYLNSDYIYEELNGFKHGPRGKPKYGLYTWICRIDIYKEGSNGVEIRDYIKVNEFKRALSA